MGAAYDITLEHVSYWVAGISIWESGSAGEVWRQRVTEHGAFWGVLAMPYEMACLLGC